MARGGWTGFLRIQDNNAATTLGSVSQGFDKVGASFKKGFFQNFNSFSLMVKGINAVVDAAKALIKESREIVTSSVKFSIPISQLGELRNVAVLSGIGVNGLTGALAGLHTTLLDAVVNPGGEAAWTLDKLGFSQDKLVAISRRTGDAFYEFVDAIRQIENATEREMRARAVWKGQYQEVMVIINKSKDEVDELRRLSHKYTDEQTKNNELAASSWDKVGERLKGIAILLTPIMGMLAAGVDFLVSTIDAMLETIISILEQIGLQVRALWEDIVARAEWAANRVATAAKRMIPANGYGKEEQERENKRDDAAFDLRIRKRNELQNSAYSALMKRDAAVRNKVGNIQGALKDFGQQGSQLLINLGLKDDQKTVATTEYRALLAEKKGINEERAVNFAKLKNAREEEQKVIENYGKGGFMHEEFKKQIIEPLLKRSDDLQEASTKVDYKIQSVFANLRKTNPNAIWDSVKGFVDKPKTDEAKPAAESFDEMNIRLSRDKSMREQSVKDYESTISSWLKWSSGVQVAELEYQNARADTIQLQMEGDKVSSERKNAAMLAERKALIKVQEERRKLDDLYAMGKNQSALADIDRKNKAIESQQGRDIFGMKMRGVSAIDQQNVIFRNSVEKMKREQAKLDALAKDPKREQEYLKGTGPAAIALKNSIQDLMFESAREMDTLMAMQFNYVSSDAAKKGMGGGISMVNNPIEIAKDSRDYLRKIYETVKGAGALDVVPTYNIDNGTQGPMGSNGVLSRGRHISSEPL